MNPVERFTDAINRHDPDAIAALLHPEFEMIVPQHPARGFKSVEQEIANMRFLFDQHPDCRAETLRMIDGGDEIWVENHLVAAGLEIAAVIIFGIDRPSGTIRWGRYYSDPVDRGGDGQTAWMPEVNSGDGRE